MTDININTNMPLCTAKKTHLKSGNATKDKEGARISYSKFDLRLFRKQKDLTQQELADMLGFSRSHIAMTETGKQEVSKKMMYEIIKNFDVTYDEFYVRGESG